MTDRVQRRTGAAAICCRGRFLGKHPNYGPMKCTLARKNIIYDATRRKWQLSRRATLAPPAEMERGKPRSSIVLLIARGIVMMGELGGRTCRAPLPN